MREKSCVVGFVSVVRHWLECVRFLFSCAQASVYRVISSENAALPCASFFSEALMVSLRLIIDDERTHAMPSWKSSSVLRPALQQCL